MKNIKQKLSGLLLVLVGLAGPALTSECMIALLALPVGIALIVTKESIMSW